MEGKYDSSSAHEGKEQVEQPRIKVIEHENARTKPVSFFPKEVTQICSDICAYFHGIDELELPPGASTRAIENLPTCPSALKDLLAEHDGGLWLLEYQLLGCAEITSQDIDGEARVIFARNVDGDALMCGVDEHQGGVYEHSDEYGIGDCLGNSLATFLEDYRNRLLSSQLEYVDECGVIECSNDGGGGGASTSNKK